MHWTRRHRRGRPPHPDVLTPAEWRVLEHVREGLPNAEIAVRLGITVRTVKAHVTSILAKTGMPDRHALAAWDGRPAEASQKARERTWGLALVEWMTEGTYAIKATATATVSLLFIVAVFAVYAFFAVGAEDEGSQSLASGGASLQVLVQEEADVRVTVDGEPVLAGRLSAGDTGLWQGDVRIELWSNNAQHVRVTVNGHDLGSLAEASTDSSWNTVHWGWAAGWSP